MNMVYIVLAILATLIFVSFLLYLYIPGMIILARFLITELAERDILFTFCPEGEIKYILSGESLKRIIMRVKGKIILVGKTPEDWRIINEEEAEKERVSPTKWKFLRRLEEDGIYFFGWPPNRVATYEFEWGKPVGLGEDLVVEHRKETVDSLRFLYIYGIKVEASEIVGMIGVNMSLTIEVEAYNPYKPVMLLAGNWFIQGIRAAVVGAVGKFAQDLNVEQIRKKDKLSREEAADLIPMIMAEVRKVRKQTGMKVNRVTFSHLDLVQKEGVEKAAQASEIARLNALGEVRTARGQAKAIKLRGEATAKAMKALVEAGGEHTGAKLLSDAIAAHGGPLSINGAGLGMIVDTRTDDVPLRTLPVRPPRKPK